MRRHLDDYPTDEKLTEALLKRVDIKGMVLEPCCGEKRMSNVLEARTGISVTSTDIIMGQEFDATKGEYWLLKAPDWTVSNPPFSEAFQIIRPAFAASRDGIAMLLRLSWLEPTKRNGDRGKWLQDNAHKMSDLIIFGQPRPRFDPTKTGSDSVTTAWMVWRHTHKGGTKIQFATGWKNG